MAEKKKVAILYGGKSVEHGVSINSARNIFEYINKDLFEPIPIGITTKGKWFLTSGVDKNIESGQALSLALNPANPVFKIEGSNQTFTADIIFPVLHGTDGEDGSIQGLIKALDIPMVGTGVLGSSVSMSKIVSKRLLENAGLPVTKFLSYTFTEKEKLNFKTIVDTLGLPFMVKAASLGSSVGVSKVSTENDFDKAVDEAFRYDNALLVEEFVKGREIECAILGNEPPRASDPGEIVISGQYDFYTFDAKYVDGDAVRIEVPAKLDSAIIEKVKDVSVRAYQTLHCEDFSRVDLFVTADGKVYVNEINTIPGFTNSSMYPMMWKQHGISFSELITELIQLATSRFEKGKRIDHEFQSNLKF